MQVYPEEGDSMIARIWHGVTLKSKADEYLQFLNQTGVHDYQATAGNLGVHVLRRIEGEHAHFLILTFWESIDAIRKFAGDDYEMARYYPEDRDYLLEFEEKAAHYEVMSGTVPAA
jgi:heme-degrading monooxygenase HmoA